MLILWHYLVIFAVALIVTTVLVPVVRRIAIRFDIVDKPGPRRINEKPIPRMGGVAMFCGIICALIVEFAFEVLGIWQGPFFDQGVFSTKLIGVIIGLCFIVGVGIVDDIRTLPPLPKFIGQIVAACIIAGTGTLLSNFKLPFSNVVISLGFWAYPFTVIYLVCFANIINLIDGLDGLAAGISAIAALCLFTLTSGLMHNDAALLSAMIVAVCVGFLFYNFNPASIFMGDSGSLLLGMALGTVSLLGSARFSSVTALAVPVVIAGIPVIDTFSAIVRRLRGHQPIQAPDVGHIHHRLLRRGLSQRTVVLSIYAWTACLSLGAGFIWSVTGPLKYLALIALLGASVYLIHFLGLFGPVLQHRRHPDPVDDSGDGDDTALDDDAD